MSDFWLWTLLAVAAIAVALFLFWRRESRPVPAALQRGQPLPEFEAVDEAGNTLSTRQLDGTPAVMIFVRGSWCPFCSKQVRNLTTYYKEISDLGARLIFVTPKPLETTRRVAEFFEVEFEFWLDETLEVTKALGLLLEGGVPKDYQGEYSGDTVWPTSLVIDSTGIIRYIEMSKHIIDRPNPKTLVRELRKTIES